MDDGWWVMKTEWWKLSDEKVLTKQGLSIDPLYINEKEYQAYGLGARQELPPAVPVAIVTSATALGSYANDPYYAYRHPQFL